MKIVNVVGARPNFMKISPIQKEMENHPKIEPILVHTGQHYDEKMSKIFFDELGLPKPDIYLGVGSASHSEQTAKIMIAFEKILLQQKPDLVLVVGDVNSTLACAIDAVKLHISVAHVEAGLRSFDQTMPEEINRILTDLISDYLFVSEQSGLGNLKNEGVNSKKVHFVGNVMIDSLVNHLDKAERSDILEKLNIIEKKFGLITLHRPSNVDDFGSIKKILSAFVEIQKTLPLVFPIHPRTQNNIEKFGLSRTINSTPNLHLIEPAGYFDFIKLMKSAKVVLTDSSGIQEETTYLKVPCLTLRENTERPATIEIGTNQLVDLSSKGIINAFKHSINQDIRRYEIPPFWDGKTAKRIVEILVSKEKNNEYN